MEAVQLEGEFKKLQNKSNPRNIADTNINRLDKIENKHTLQNYGEICP